MKKCLVFLFVLFCFSPLFAFMEKADIEYVKSHGLFSGELEGNFVQTKGMTGSDRTFISRGRVIISPENGIAWFYEKPYKSILVVAEDHITQKIRDNEPKRLNVSDNEIYRQIASSIECVFFGDFETMFNVFNGNFKKDENIWQISLSPKDEMLSVFISSIVIKGKDEIKSLMLTENTGDTILYEFENLKQRTGNNEEKAVWSI